MDDMPRLQALESRIKELVPSFEIRFKDESLLMKILGKLMFFNKGFMTDYITTLGSKVYFQSRKAYYGNPLNSFRVLAHEFVHVWDYVQHPIQFVLKYIFPQILALASLFSFLGFIHPAFLLFLISLICLAPIPSPGRKQAEIRGYGMSLKVFGWWGCSLEDVKNTAISYAEHFCDSSYYYMYPFRETVIKELQMWAGEFCPDEVPFKEVYKLIKT